ncbi:MAG: STAS domain-containing protein [Saccharofermentanales bacterium]|jgi:anti-sigma B factor antagonist|nr:STAS domain-containing protein [Clostridiaceae bacterium]
MNIIKTINGDTMVLSVEGRLDTTTAPILETELASSLDPVSKLILDFAELEYLSSAGLRVLLVTQKKMNDKGSMIVRNVNDSIMEVFEITGFLKILTVENETE